jgi:hypothetical protein
VRACLADGGRFCICDVDDTWLSVTPRPPALDSFLQRVARAQAARGGDRHVGGKLAHLLLRSGYSDIRSTAMLVSTELIGKQSFCDLVFGYKLEVVPAAELAVAREEVRAIEQQIMAPHGWAGIAVFFVSGRAGSARDPR